MNRVLPLLLLLSGCAVGPDYERPRLDAPQKWSLPSVGGQEEQGISSAPWWQAFGDPLLSELMERAMAANKDLKIAEARLREARADTTAQEASIMPSFFAMGSSQRERNVNPILPLRKPYNTLRANFDAVWEVDLFGRIRRATEAAQAEEEAAIYGVHLAELSLSAEVARHYVIYCQLKQQRATLEESLDHALVRQNLQQLRVEKGDAPQESALTATRALSDLQGQLEMLTAALSSTQHTLEILLGEQPNALKTLLFKAEKIPQVAQFDPLAAPAAVLRHRPDVQMAERHLAAATAMKGVAIAGLYPSISLSAFVGRAAVTRHNFWNHKNKSHQVYGDVHLPLFSFGRQMAGIEASDARLEQARLAFEQAALAALGEVESFAMGYLKAQDSLAHITSSHHAALKSLDLASHSLEKGALSKLNHADVALMAQQSSFKLAEAQAEAAMHFIGLQKAVGGHAPAKSLGTN
ncbi:MAG: efflux transporter outer membrane subunit [Holosporales bacterium]